MRRTTPIRGGRGGFFEVLAELNVAEKQRGFYAQWVRQFFNFKLGNRRRRDLGLKDIHHFLETLKTDENLAAWQIEQAHDALFKYTNLSGVVNSTMSLGAVRF